MSSGEDIDIPEEQVEVMGEEQVQIMGETPSSFKMAEFLDNIASAVSSGRSKESLVALGMSTAEFNIFLLLSLGHILKPYLEKYTGQNISCICKCQSHKILAGLKLK